MSREKFIANLIQLKLELTETKKSIRELKSLYFSLNLDYIRQCENNSEYGYHPSKDCDLKMREYHSDKDSPLAIQIINRRIEQVLGSFK